MVCMDHGPRMRKDLGMNDEVAISLPAFIWHGFTAVYLAHPDKFHEAHQIAKAAQYALLDPVYIREAEAAHQEMESRNPGGAIGLLGALFANPDEGDDNDPRLGGPQ